MPLNLKMKNSTEVLDKLCHGTAQAPTLTAFKDQVTLGNIKIDTGFWAITLAFPNTPGADTIGVNLPCSVTQIMKGGADPATVALATQHAVELMKAGLKAVLNTAPAPAEPAIVAGFNFDKAAQKAAQPEVLEPKKANPVDEILNQLAKQPAPSAQGASAVAAEKYKKLQEKAAEKKAKQQAAQAKVAASGVVKLRDAALLGQPVHGTSAGSVYYAVALSERVKIGARIKMSGANASISLRAEGEPDADEAHYLTGAGMAKASEGHYSVHLESQGVPVARVIGAFLLGLGIEFDEQVTSHKQLKVE